MSPIDVIEGPSEAESAARARAAALIKVLCHDLRSPLSSLILAGQVLRGAVSGREAVEHEVRLVDAVLRSAERIRVIVTNLHDLALADSGQLPAEVSRVSAGSLIGSFRATLGATLGESEALVRVLEPAEGMQVFCDRNLVLRALIALVENAIRYVPRDGHIEVSLVSDSHGHTRFTVSDDGPGMAESRLAHAFDLAWHASQSSRDGAGVGLPLVRGIARAHGGDASVVPADPRGLRASFWLPSA